MSWRKCSMCKSEIGLGAVYYVCSVTTCQSKATNYAFCGVACWDAHLPVERHRSASAGAIERIAPKVPQAEPPRRIVARTPEPGGAAASDPDQGGAVLVVVSKVRQYVQQRAGMNTGGAVYALLSEKIRELCDGAIDKARAEGRKTILDRDF